MMKYRIIFTSIFLTFMWSASPDFIGEELKYSAGFRFFPAGEAILTFSADSLNRESVYKLTTSVKTNSFLDAFYEVRDEIKSWLNPKNLSLKKTIQSIREGSYHRDYQSIILDDSIAVSGNNSRKIPGMVYDPVAFVYYLRTQNLDLGNNYHFLSYSQKKTTEVMVDITAIETIRVSAGTFTCLKAEPVSPDGKPLLKNNGEMRVWLSNDYMKLPVKIELKTNIGTLVMKLKERKYSTY